MITATLEAPIGHICMRSEDGLLTWIGWDEPDIRPHGQCDLLDELSQQMRDYFAGKRKEFDIPERYMAPAPTPWQQRIRDGMLEIPAGQSISYGELAARAGGNSRRHARAAGQACGCNPLSLLVPCHRVLAGDGSLHGYGGGLKNKAFLLQMEGHPGF